ncbi:Endo-1,4-beta-xylanase A precursor [Enhygromyxa salina]|uniref:Endo-1,4-beta-xylanase A n=1 Tax=Enhygromyxa salina TaxID=215803 RepID=A0A0C1ZPK4_9BACT|nr:hypothetical protein [Enhygromyxa salina]KIG12963.1 Endo-1,4-beta-xylanase A precursor [Enhygromyxa salina]
MQRLRALAWSIPVVTLAFIGCDGDAADSNGDAAVDSTESGDGDGTTGDGDGDTGDGDGDGDTGDGDTGDGDGDTGDGDGDTGDGDDPANAACDALANATPQLLVAATSAAEAATATVVPDGQVVYTVTLPEGAAGFVQLQIADWETTQAFFTTADIDYQITVESNSQVEQPREPAAACPNDGITDQRVFFPHWTPATIEFSATGPREVPLMIIQQQ